MKPAIKRKWVTALRSGNYRQAQGEMRNKSYSGSYSYCCLGVLRVLMHPGSSAIRDDEEDVLCREHQAEAGITYKQQQRLADMNDGGSTFKEIADYIERKL